MAKLDREEPLSESYISIGLGILVVVVVGILIYNFISQRGKTQPQPSPQTSEEATTAARPGVTYKVQSGDTLWSISEKSYGTGFNWTDIAKVNNLAEGDKLEEGQELTIPEVTPFALTSPGPEQVAMASPAASQLPATGEPAPALPQTSPQTLAPVTITGNSYTVVNGDTLWDIACRAYGDCYAWTRIAEANKLVNPDLIHPGNVFTLPR